MELVYGFMHCYGTSWSWFMVIVLYFPSFILLYLLASFSLLLSGVQASSHFRFPFLHSHKYFAPHRQLGLSRIAYSYFSRRWVRNRSLLGNFAQAWGKEWLRMPDAIWFKFEEQGSFLSFYLLFHYSCKGVGFAFFSYYLIFDFLITPFSSFYHCFFSALSSVRTLNS